MSSGARTVWCEHALLPSGVADRVAIDIDAGRFTRVTAGADPTPGADRRAGLTIPGPANAHSHAFHRALRHRSEVGTGTFWTWREQMYRVAAALDPDRYHRLARAAFAEMVLSGYVVVGEFHYLHHRPDGGSYDDPNAMGAALVAAAAEAGVRITLLDTAYLHGGLEGGSYREVSGPQHRFADAGVDAWTTRMRRQRLDGHARLGAAVHSVRAVDPDAIAAIARCAAEADLPLHAHVSEQPAENEQCRAVHGATPTEVFERAGALGPTFTAVHATHVSDRDASLLGGSESTVCLCPTTERDLGDGVGDARHLIDRGAQLAIGSDSHAVVDPFEETRAIELDLRMMRRERGVLGVGELAAAMTGGHVALGWRDAGLIRPGRRADLVTVSLATARTAGARPEALWQAVVYAASASDVTQVTVDGVDVVRDGRHLTIDVAHELERAIADVLGAAA